jgi:carbamoyltransferase
MRVLGISPLDKDATASFLEDGRVLFACGEERLSRLKLQDGFPHQAVRLGLERTGWDPASIDVVAYAFFDGDEEARLIQESLGLDAQRNRWNCTADSLGRLRAVAAGGYRLDRSQQIPGLPREADEFMPPKSWLKRQLYGLVARSPLADWQAHRHFFRRWSASASADHRERTRQLQEGLAEYGLAGKLRRYHHHDTHAANAFYASGFEESLLVILDGYGSGKCGGVYVGDRQGVRPLHRFAFPNSLGQHYENVTSALGFKPSRHEGKIVGLAAYGNRDVLRQTLRDRFVVQDGDIVIRGGMNYLFTRALTQRFAKRDIAAAYQQVLEDVTQEMVRYWLAKTGMKNVAVSGGVHANVKLNQRIREIAGVEQVFVYPNMGDGGCGTGAAMLAFDRDCFPARPFENVYFGPDFTETQIEAVLRKNGLAYERVAGIERRVAELLTQDYIVGRFNGRMEYGPRALGNRSILYPARDPEVNQWLNHQLGRTEFMPFAPAALASEAHRLFKNVSGCEKTAEFMTVTFDCTPDMIRLCPAAVHVDGTARPQLVSERTNASFHRIIRHYFELTGIPAIINTSFNMHEEPIVCSPADATRAFLIGNIDFLAIGPFLVPHPRLQEIMQERRVNVVEDRRELAAAHA